MKHSIQTLILGLAFVFGSHAQEGSKDSIILIEITSNIKFHWNNSTSKIVKDSLWKELKASYPKHKKTLIQKVGNHEPTEAKVCYVQGTISKGQMAFIVLDKLERIPYAKVFEMQYCVFHIGCPYVEGLIDSVHHNKDAVQQLMDYFYPKNK